MHLEIFLSTFVTLLITNMNTRLKQFLAAENISQSQFADTIKVVRASVSHVLSGRNNPGYDFIKAIMTAYPALNIEWLMLGKGKMYKEAQAETIQASIVAEPSIPEEAPGLFDEISFLDPVINTPAAQDDANITELKQTFTSNAPAQVPVKQRKVIKITILFDDGTYQEL